MQWNVFHFGSRINYIIEPEYNTQCVYILTYIHHELKPTSGLRPICMKVKQEFVLFWNYRWRHCWATKSYPWYALSCQRSWIRRIYMFIFNIQNFEPIIPKIRKWFFANSNFLVMDYNIVCVCIIFCLTYLQSRLSSRWKDKNWREILWASGNLIFQ